MAGVEDAVDDAVPAAGGGNGDSDMPESAMLASPFTAPGGRAGDGAATVETVEP